MEKLIQFIELQYKMAKEWGADPMIMCNQAFGALELYHFMYPDQYAECEKLWNNEWRDKFYALAYGGAENA